MKDSKECDEYMSFYEGFKTFSYEMVENLIKIKMISLHSFNFRYMILLDEVTVNCDN